MKSLSFLMCSVLLSSCSVVTNNPTNEVSSANIYNLITTEKYSSTNNLVISVAFDYDISKYKTEVGLYTCTLDLSLKEQGSLSLAKTDTGICYLNAQNGRVSVTFTDPVKNMNTNISEIKAYLPEFNKTLKSPLEYHVAISEQVDENKFIKIARSKNIVVETKI
jgi:hypothetical protein